MRKAPDSFDQRLMNLLAFNAGRSSAALARQLGVSPSTVRRRKERLIRDGVLRIIAVPDPTRAGYNVRAIIAFDVAHDSLDSAMEKLSRYPEITWLSAIAGRFDLMAIGWFTTPDHLFNFMRQEVSKLEGIRNTETFVCLYTKKSF